MTIDTLKSMIPDYAKDLKLNLSSLSNDETLNEQQLWGVFVACAFSAGNKDVLQNIIAEAKTHLSDKAMTAAKAAGSIMAMNNVYYKFVGMAADDAYKSLPAKLRMNVIGNPGVDKIDFELWSLAVSAINGCQYCVNAHEPVLIKGGMSKEQVQTAVRVGSVVQAVSNVLNAESSIAA